MLKSGEDVIADIQEMVIDERVVGYFFGNPCIVKVLAKNYDDSGNQSKSSGCPSPGRHLSKRS